MILLDRFVGICIFSWSIVQIYIGGNNPNLTWGLFELAVGLGEFLMGAYFLSIIPEAQEEDPEEGVYS